jgi:hypothetical protein
MIGKIYMEVCAFVCILCETENISMARITFNFVQSRQSPLNFFRLFGIQTIKIESSHFVVLFSSLEQRIDEIGYLVYLKNIDLGYHC